MNYIEINGAREHNLKSVSVRFPRNSFVLVTGVSGSGKSSLVQNVIANEGQRLFLSQLNSRARQHFGKLGKAEVDEIKGMSPVISLDQISLSSNIRSTVGTLSEIYDYLRLLFARYSKSIIYPDVKYSRAHFSFNQDEGACDACKGLGVEEYIDPDTFLIDASKSIRDGALSLTTPTGYVIYSQVTLDVLAQVCEAEGFDLGTPWKDLSPENIRVILYGSNKIKIPFGKHTLESRMKWSGITAKPREEGYYRGIIPIMEEILKRDRNKNILKYTRSRKCSHCLGKRLKKECLSFRWQGRDIADWSALSILELMTSLREISKESNIVGGEKELINTIIARAEIIGKLGINYLSLDRESTSLSSGEIKRLRLSTLIQDALSGLVYTLDEPTVGLHPRDHENLLALMRNICDLGNTMIVIDHKNIGFDFADYWIELGPEAGYKGGELIFSGDHKILKEQTGFLKSPSWEYLSGQSKLNRHKGSVSSPEWIEIRNCDVNNLKAESIKFLAHHLNIICGVSGAGKSSLLTGTLHPLLEGVRPQGSKSSLHLCGQVNKVIRIDQKPIGRNSRSNPATYTKLFDRIRDLFGKQPEVKERGWDKSRFSFNVDGGRCPECKGAGAAEIGLSYLGSVEIICDTCNGRRFTPETLEIKYKAKNIFEVLEMEVEEARDFFQEEKNIFPYLDWLSKLGLGYLKLGQPSGTLSGGEAQRIKLATQLVRPSKGHTVYLLDEPASGLHPSDIQVLLDALEELVKKGHTLIMVEHDPALVSLSDWIVELGPESGSEGGRLIFSGNAEDHKLSKTPMSQAITKDIQRRTHIETVLSPGRQELKGLSKGTSEIVMNGICTNNLNNIDIRINTGEITAITGVSGSGKTSLLYDTIYRSSQFYFTQTYSTYVRSLIGGTKPGDFQNATGLLPSLAIAQKAQKINPRSTMATISGLYPVLRLLFSRFAADEHQNRSGLMARQFSFNDKSGACVKCSGLGTIKVADPDKLVSNNELSVYEGAMAGTRTGKFFSDPDGQYIAILKTVEEALSADFTLPWNMLGKYERDIILFGTGIEAYEVTWNYRRKNNIGSHQFTSEWKGMANLVSEEYEKRIGTTRQSGIENVMKEVTCPSCEGHRLKNERLKYKLDGLDIAGWLELSVDDIIEKIKSFDGSNGHLNEVESVFIINSFSSIFKVLITLKNLGMGYLQLNRISSSLSSGEYQRLRLAAQLGSELTGLLYLVDEPSTALHPSNQDELWKVLKAITQRGNTVVMVDHNPHFYGKSDTIYELGPGGGDEGGNIVSVSRKGETKKNQDEKSYLKISESRGEFNQESKVIQLENLGLNNLKIKKISLPEGWTSIIGVSGSGKSSLMKEIVNGFSKKIGLAKVIQPGKETRSWMWQHTPLSGLGIDTQLRKAFCGSLDQDIRINPNYFMLTRKGGRCEECQGKGFNVISLDYLGNSHNTCEACGGTGFNSEAIGFTSQGFAFNEILEMSLSHLLNLNLWPVLKPALDKAVRMGLGYLKAGQQGDSLSSGEKQRLLLVCELLKENQDKCVFLFDEPSRGLHSSDSERFIDLIEELIIKGHTIVMVEHNPELIMRSDWLIELGPGGGEQGGEVVFEGIPEKLIREGNTTSSEVLGRLVF